MAQKEVALMQQRTGKQRDLPNGELGQVLFTTDEARVFVGLPSTAQPASLVAGRNQTNAPNRGNENVEVLTEFTPWDILNGTINKPFTVTAAASTSTTFNINGTSRLFIDYIAYDGDSALSILESGTIQMVALQNTTILSQQNNTTQSEGVVCLDFNSPVYSTDTKRLTLTVTNTGTSSFTIEFILRGWDI